MECIFCKIAKNDMDAFTIYEDDIVKAFLDIHPDANGHTLIIPKKHFKDIDDIDEKTITHIMMVAKKLKKVIISTCGADGMTLIQNNGEVQEVKHFHLHLKPYYVNKVKKMKVEDVHHLITEAM